MNGPRGSFVIALLILIAAEIAWVGGAITGSGSWLGGLLFLFFVIALVRVVVELFREGAQSASKEPAPERPKRRQAARVEEPVTATAMRDPDGGGSHLDDGVAYLDPEKRRPAQF